MLKIFRGNIERSRILPLSLSPDDILPPFVELNVPPSGPKYVTVDSECFRGGLFIFVTI